MTKRELMIIFDTLNWATDQVDDIIGQGPTDEKYWFKVQRRTNKSFEIVKREIRRRSDKKANK